MKLTALSHFGRERKSSSLVKFVSLALLVFLMGILSINLAAEPNVYCYCLGVSDTPGSSLTDAKQAASDFAGLIRTNFPTAKINLFTSPTNPATNTTATF